MTRAIDALIPVLIRLFQTLRTEQGLSQDALADRANIHRTTIGLLERGDREPSLSIAAQIAEGLGYPLSELLAKARLISEGKLSEEDAFAEEKVRLLDPRHLRNCDVFEDFIGLRSSALLEAIQGCYHTLDMMDDQLTFRNSPPVARLVELANLSSMVGNLVGGAFAEASQGLYQRNRPHHYPDLLPLRQPARNLELKVALETNRPKGHLPKPGRFITFRYVLGDRRGNFVRGKEFRGDTVWFWEVKIGSLRETDYAISNTAGDSGKTAVIKSEKFKSMALVYFNPSFCPHPANHSGSIYPGFN